MKILKQETYDQLVAKANNYDNVVNAMVSAGANAEDVNPESMLAAMEPHEREGESAADTQVVDNLNQTITQLTIERDDLRQRAETAEQRVTELEGIPAAAPVGGKNPEPGAQGASSLEEVNTSLKSKDFASRVEMVRSLI